MTRLEFNILWTIRKATKPVTAAYLAITLDRRRETVETALASLVAQQLVIAGRAAYRAAPRPVATEGTRVVVCRDGYADGYGWEAD